MDAKCINTNCSGGRMMSVHGHCRDMCNVTIEGHELHEGGYYVYEGLNIGGGDDLEFTVCLDCGQMQGKWPLTLPAKVEAVLENAKSPKTTYRCQWCYRETSVPESTVEVPTCKSCLQLMAATNI